MTEEQELLLDCWMQWSYETKVKGVIVLNDGGLSTLEEVGEYLERHNIIDGQGFPVEKGKDDE
jgi:hypothetical protein